MKNTTVGVDPSSFETGTVTLNTPASNQIQSPAPDPSSPAPHPLTDPAKFPTVVQIVNGVVTPALQVLLFDVLSTIDASIPNRDQNKAVKRLIHDGFDRTYADILRESYPDSNFSFGPGHAIQPVPDKSNAILGMNKLQQ